MCTAQHPITPNSTYIERIIDMLERIALNQQQICVETLSQSSSIVKSKALRVQARGRAKSFFRRHTGFVNEEV
jgi:hypothetical protein